MPGEMPKAELLYHELKAMADGAIELGLSPEAVLFSYASILGEQIARAPLADRERVAQEIAKIVRKAAGLSPHS